MPPPDAWPDSALYAPRPLERHPELAARAVDLLSRPPALIGLDESEARRVVARMHLLEFAKGAALIRENDDRSTGHMLLVLGGEVSVEIGDDPLHAAHGIRPVAISVVGAGALLGEMALLDGEPRSTQCTALSLVQAAGLSREGLQTLIGEEPRIAAKLLSEVGCIVATRLRAMNDQLRLYAQLAADQRREIERLKGGAGGSR
jgi:CRP/FNR family transcriptional regulator, cyclic AMP receptor protein